MQIRRIHFALPVSDLDRSVAFYRSLLQADPVRVRPGYAKFAPDLIPINLALNQAAAPARTSATHFGMEVADAEAVRAWTERLAALDLPTRVETGVTCCWGIQDKVWVTDPDGHDWEVYTLLDDAHVERDDTNACCPEVCCT